MPQTPLNRTPLNTSPVKTANIHDVAREAGVSYQTVSRVINGHPSVAPHTRARVEAAIQVLGYRPSSVARSLAAKRTTTLGVVSFGTVLYGPAQMLASLEEAARRRGYQLSIVGVSALSMNEIGPAIEGLRAQRVAGILFITPLRQVEAAPIDELCRGLPFLLVDAEPQAGRDVVAIDQFEGGCLAARHLTDLGHRHVALLGGPEAWYDALRRREGWLSALAKVGVSPAFEAQGDWTAAAGYAETRRLLAGGAVFSALLAGNDYMALGAIRALGERGLRVPAHVSVVGFDDVPEAAFYAPPLTTVRQDFRALGRRGLDVLVRRIEQADPSHDGGHGGREDTPSVSALAPPTLQARASTAPPTFA